MYRTLIVLMILVFALAQSDAASKFEFLTNGKGPNNQTALTVKEGDKVRLDCRTTNSSASVSLIRMKGASRETIKVDGKKLKQNGQTFILKTKNVDDGGDVACLAVNQFQYITKYFVIYVDPHGKNPEPVVEPQSLEVDQGKNFQIKCSAPGLQTTLSWTKNDKEVDKSLTKRKTYTLGGQGYIEMLLVLTKATLQDSGFYTCHSKTPMNPSFQGSQKAAVTVKVTKLKWMNNDPFFNVVQVSADDSAMIDCRVNDPNAKVQFLKEQNDGTVSEIRPNGRKYKTVNKQQLIINRATRLDSAQYRCRTNGIQDKTVMVFINPIASRNLRATIMVRSLRLEYFGSGSLTCSAIGNDVILTWYKESEDGLNLTPVSADRTKLKGTYAKQGYYVKELKLKFTNVTLKDKGFYVCKVHKSLSPSKNAMASARVRVRDPKKPTIKSFKPVTVLEGNNATFVCRTRGSPIPRISFWIGTTKVTNKPRKYQIKGDTFVLLNAKFPNDDIDIICRAESALGTTEKTADLTVQVLPVLRGTKDNVIFASGNQTTNVTCEVARANPMPLISWVLQPSACTFTESDCKPLEDAWEAPPPGSRVIPAPDQATMKSVLNVNLAGFDYFLIRCTVDNGVGRVQHLLRYVNKADTGKRLTVEPEKTVVQNEGASLSLSCFGAPGSFSSLNWYKNGQMVKEDNGVRLTYVETKNYVQEVSIHVNVSSPTHSGSYVCNGTRKFRSNMVVTETVDVTVKAVYKPTVKPLKNIVARQSSTIVLVCNVNANPEPNIIWLKDRTAIENISPLYGIKNCEKSQNGHYYKMSGKVNTNELVICKADFQRNNATYTCVAENELGQDNKSATVIVHAAPMIVHGKKSAYVKAGAQLAEKCVATGNPPPVVWWEREIDGKFKKLGRQTLSRSYLNFKKIRKEEFGEYRCVAENFLGNSVSKFLISKIPSGAASAAQLAKSNATARITLIATVIVASILIILLSIISVILYKRRRLYGGFYIFAVPPAPDYLKKIDPSRALSEQTNKLPYDIAWEFPRTRVKMLQKLGSGAFGEVFSAEAVGILAHDPRYKILTKQRPLLGRRRASRSGSTSSRTGGSTSSAQGLMRGSFSRGSFTRNGSTRGSYRNMKGYKNLVSKVAVKKLKGDATPLELRDLISELKILIHIGEHPNIVNLLGACTKGKEGEMMVILEYAPYGNLLSFLKDRRPIFKPVLTKEYIGMENELTTLDLVVTAYQVAKGMEYLSSRKCVHRDLAARNVLVGDNYVMKIADFGLARDIYKDDRYVKVTGGLLPIKWMALEAIRERVFTHQSDVWSFGVLLWELMTLGGSPYPGMPTKDLLDFLAAGYRMEQPLNCPLEIYSVMRDCWHEDPNDRPIFFEIVNQLARFVEQNCSSDECVSYLDAAHLSGDDYLRPVDSPAPVFSPPPYTPEEDNRTKDVFFNSNNGYLPCKKGGIDAEIVQMNDIKRDSFESNTGERKRKADELEREKRTTSDSDSSYVDGCHGNGKGQANGGPKISYDEDKDIDETELLLNDASSQPNRYINEDIIIFKDQSYVNT